MKKIFTTISLTLALGSGILAYAGEGHDHGVPGEVSAPKGGEIKPAVGSYFELLKEENKTKVFVYKPTKDKGGKTVLEPLSLSKVTLTNVTATPMPNGKAEKITLAPHEDHFMTEYTPPKGKNRYVLLMEFTVEGNKDSVKFNVEKN
jgi:hypothetical protein